MSERKRLKINLDIVEWLEDAEKTLREISADMDAAYQAGRPIPFTAIDLRRMRLYALGKVEMALEEIKGEST